MATEDSNGHDRLRQRLAHARALGEGLAPDRHTDAVAAKILQARNALVPGSPASSVEAWKPQGTPAPTSTEQAARQLTNHPAPSSAPQEGQISEPDISGYKMPMVSLLLEKLGL
jgi:hypothetical protein